MKAAANGALNLSTLDGWWDEVWHSPDRSTGIGWAIGKGETYSDPSYQDEVEAEALYDVLERDVIPKFYDRGPDRLPRKWIDQMKASIGGICHFVNTHRMVKDYTLRILSQSASAIPRARGRPCGSRQVARNVDSPCSRTVAARTNRCCRVWARHHSAGWDAATGKGQRPARVLVAGRRRSRALPGTPQSGRRHRKR